MTQYNVQIIPNPLGNFEAFIHGLCKEDHHHNLASGIIDEIEERCRGTIRSKDAYARTANSLEIHFFRVYPLGVRFRGVSFALLCLVVDQDKKMAYLLGGWLCETDDEVERTVRTAYESAKRWASASAADTE